MDDLTNITDPKLRARLKVEEASMTDAADLRRLAVQATPGPWHAPNPPDGVGEGMLYADDGWAIVDSFLFATEERRQATSGWRVPFTRPDGQHMRDAAYIAAANPQRILALISALESAEAKAESLLDERDDKAEVLEGSFQTNALLIERVQAAERRVAALEEGLRRVVETHDAYIVAVNGHGHDRQPHDEYLRYPNDPSMGLSDCSACAGAQYGTEDEVHDAVEKARALLAAAPSEPHAYEAEADGRCVTCGQYGALIHTDPTALPAEDEDIPEAFGRLVQGGPVSEASDE